MFELQATFILFVHLDAALSSCVSRVSIPWVQFPFWNFFFFFWLAVTLLTHTEMPSFLYEQSQQIPSRQLDCHFCRMLKMQRIAIMFLQFPWCHSTFWFERLKISFKCENTRRKTREALSRKVQKFRIGQRHEGE